MPPRNRVRPEMAERIIAAMAGMETARQERDAAISDALKAGASIREVAAASGMSTTSIQKIGRDNGWPTAAQKKAWADEQGRARPLERRRRAAPAAGRRLSHP